MNSKQIKQILESPITKAAKGRFISIEELEQIKTILEAWEVVKEYGAITIDKDVNRITIILYISPAKEGYDKLEKALGVNNNEI